MMGTYKDMSRYSNLIHLGIKVLSTALLAGSSYCMQCLSSPTRQEVDTAHSRGTYLNIGISSWRNILARGKKTPFLLALLMFSIVTLHAT
ncbi:hypothetical protein PSPO01_11816 [Paraphaeosphaeria sporulosa]